MIKQCFHNLFFGARQRHSNVQLHWRRTLVQHIFIEHYSPISASQYLRLIQMVFAAFFTLFASPSFAQQNLTIKFSNTANGKILAPDSTYHNASDEPYAISKLKYYISNISLRKKAKNVFLINAFESNSIKLDLAKGRYDSISFLLGVDSIQNTGGAQSGALDPLNDMFWTWNSGYVTFKLEGLSDSSHADLHRIEHHIGGYKGKYKTMRTITLALPKTLFVKNKEQHTIIIEMNLDKYWYVTNNISIKETPVIVVAGALAARSADNFTQLFSIQNVQ